VPKFACCLLYNVYAVRLVVCPNAEILGVGKNSPAIFSCFWTKVCQILWACGGVVRVNVIGHSFDAVWLRCDELVADEIERELVGECSRQHLLVRR